MKTFTLLLAAVLTAGAVIGAEIDPCAKAVNPNTGLPTGWLKDSWSQAKGEITLVPRTDAAGQDIKLAGTAGEAFFFHGDGTASEKDDVWEIKAKVSGKGKVRLGYMGYAPGGKYLFGKSKAFELTSDDRTISSRFTVEDSPEFATKLIRVYISVDKGGEGILKSFSLEEVLE